MYIIVQPNQMLINRKKVKYIQPITTISLHISLFALLIYIIRTQKTMLDLQSTHGFHIKIFNNFYKYLHFAIFLIKFYFFCFTKSSQIVSSHQHALYIYMDVLLFNKYNFIFLPVRAKKYL